MHPLSVIATASKRIAVAPQWSPPEAETGYAWFNVSLEINGIIEAGIVFSGGCYIDRPDCHVSFEIKVSRIPGRKAIPLMRIDWRSLNGGHSNDRRWGGTLAGKRVSSTHFHEFDLNWCRQKQRLFQNLPLAREIDDNTDTFEALRATTGNSFGISNIDIVPRPDWVYKLL